MNIQVQNDKIDMAQQTTWRESVVPLNTLQTTEDCNMPDRDYNSIEVGRKFGSWTVTGKVFKKDNILFFPVKCICGFSGNRRAQQIYEGTSTQCVECYRKARKKESICHDANRKDAYTSWRAMRRRCVDPKYGYIQKGITVCDIWEQSFERFYSDMGPRPDGMTLDRIDNSKGYYGANCRWASAEQQAWNRCTNVEIEYNGKTMCVSAWEKELGFKKNTISTRLKRGWPISRALTEPVHLSRTMSANQRRG